MPSKPAQTRKPRSDLVVAASLAADLRWRVRKKIAAMLRKAKIDGRFPWINGEVLDSFVSTTECEATVAGGRTRKGK